MARLADEVVARIKAEVSLVRLIEGQGRVLKKQGKDYVMACPFHDDATPSLVVSPDSNLWHCLGACQAGGSVIDWVMKTQGVSFRLACELLQKDLGLALEAPVQPVKRATTKKLTSPLAAEAADAQALLRQVIDY